MTRAQLSALELLAQALDACKAAGVSVSVPGRDYIVLDLGTEDPECLDLSFYGELDSVSLNALIKSHRSN